jgi:hypothetical protein
MGESKNVYEIRKLIVGMKFYHYVHFYITVNFVFQSK